MDYRPLVRRLYGTCCVLREDMLVVLLCCFFAPCDVFAPATRNYLMRRRYWSSHWGSIPLVFVLTRIV